MSDKNIIMSLHADLERQKKISEEFQHRLEVNTRLLNGMINTGQQLIEAINNLTSESEGVVGYHLNGEVATWDELLPRGQFPALQSKEWFEESLMAASNRQEKTE